ncbi:MAG: glycosyltransferase family 4 protein, partial [Pseudomonadota bacterium]
IGREHDLNEAARLRNLVTQADLDSRIHLVGELSAEELKKDYARATFFALATRYEGHGLVFDEALVHGLPIVSCRAGAVPDTVPEEAGLLVPPDDPNTFADALRHMLSQPDAYARFSEAARAAGQALPAWSETAQTVSTVLNQVPLTSAGPR